LGKTQSVIALCEAFHELKRADISVAVAASKVEALCEVKRDMLRAGIPEDIRSVLSVLFAGMVSELNREWQLQQDFRSSLRKHFTPVTPTTTTPPSTGTKDKHD